MCKEHWIASSPESWPWVRGKETGVRDEAGVWFKKKKECGVPTNMMGLL